MNSYGFYIKRINNLNHIQPNKKIHYIYKDIDFLYGPGSGKLVFSFHGAIKTTCAVFFRGFNWDVGTVVCFSDPVVKKYKGSKLKLAWYMATKKINTNKIIVEIISYIINMVQSHETIFTGSSGGGFVAIRYACIFKQTALVMNSQLYLRQFSYYKKLVAILGANRDSLVGPDNVEKLLELYGKPKKIVLYINNKDTSHLNHARQFRDYVKAHGLANILIYHEFESGGSKKHHKVLLPGTLHVTDILKKMYRLPKDFNWQKYLALNPDLKEKLPSKQKCEWHYVHYGWFHNRRYKN
jgi:hypothetical protein